MARETKGRDRRRDGATPTREKLDARKYTDSLFAWYALARASQAHRQPKRQWRRGR